jgi:hypothetical protein
VEQDAYARRISHSTTATMPMMARIVMTIPMALSYLPSRYFEIFRAVLPAVSCTLPLPF